MPQIRKSKVNNFTLNQNAQSIIDTVKKDKSKFVSEAIILKHKIDSESVKQFKS